MPLSKLNSQQRNAVTAPKGIVRVIAGAGSGKTTCIMAKIVYEVQKGTPPNKIIALTFTKKAGMELKTRLRAQLGAVADRIYTGTFHAFAHQHLFKVLSYSLISDNDVHDIIDNLIEEYGDKLPYDASEVVSLLGFHRNLQKDYTDPILKKIEVEFKQVKLKNNLKDYDDLLEDFLTLLKKDFFKNDYELVIVDEGQDNSRLQNSITRELIKKHRNLFIVGDGMQSIYGWRGSDLNSFLSWSQDGATDYPLAINYRSTKEVIKVANRILEVIPGEAKVKLISVREKGATPPKVAKVGNGLDEVEYIASKIRELHAQGHPYHSMVVLYRAHYLSNALQLKLGEMRVPFNVWSGQNMLTAQHIQDCLCFLRAYTNPQDVVAWSRIFRLLPKIGKVTGQKLAQEVVRTGIHNYEESKVEAIKSIFRTTSDAHFINAVQSFYVPIVRENFPDSTKDVGVQKFLDFARAHKDLKQFVSDIMFSEKAESAENPGVVLTTIHQAKGLEWDNVFVMGIYDGAFPSGKTEMVDEEFRLFYVAVTRAKTNLFLTFPENSIGQWSKPTTSIFYDLLLNKVPDASHFFRSHEQKLAAKK